MHVRRIAVEPQTPISALDTRKKKPCLPVPLDEANKLYMETLSKYDKLASDLRWKTGIYRVLHTEDCKKCEYDRTRERVLLKNLSKQFEWYKKENRRIRIQTAEIAFENESLRDRVCYLERLVDVLEHSHHK